MKRLISKFAEVDKELALWNESWWLDGYTVTCKACDATQDIEAAEQPFPHKKGCQIFDRVGQYPWQILREAGKKMRYGSR